MAIVALASLLAGFVVVFAGGMMFLAPAATTPPPPPTVSAPLAADAGMAVATPAVDAGAGGSLVETPEPAGDAAPAAAGSVRFAPSAVSRCWDANNPAVLPGTACDRLQAIDEHFASKAAEIAGCARGHGRLAFIMDLRFSTAFVRSWGGPSSTIGNAGAVVACVRRVTQPLPFATAQHAHDRYLMVLPIDW